MKKHIPLAPGMRAKITHGRFSVHIRLQRRGFWLTWKTVGFYGLSINYHENPEAGDAIINRKIEFMRRVYKATNKTT